MFLTALKNQNVKVVKDIILGKLDMKSRTYIIQYTVFHVYFHDQTYGAP